MGDKLSEIKEKLANEKADTHTENYLTYDDVEWLIEKIDRYEDLALEHHYQTILDDMMKY